MITRVDELPVRHVPCLPACRGGQHAGHCRRRAQLAGHGRSLDPARAPLSAWWDQLRAWHLPYNTPAEQTRLWYVTAAPVAGRQAVRLLPSCNRELRAYPPGRRVDRAWAARGEITTQGPYYVLSFRDARALWVDTHCEVRPATDGEWEHTPDLVEQLLARD